MADPVTLGASTALPNFLAKWQQLQPIASQLPPSATASVFNLDLTKLKAGEQTLSPDEITLGLQSAANLQNNLPTQKPEGLMGLVEHVPSAFLGDVSNVLTNVPRLPGQLVKTATELPESPGLIEKAIQDKSIHELSQVPGVNLIPGATTLGNIAHPTQFLKHPGLTALDLAPYTSEALDLVPDSFKEAVKAPLTQTLDKFGVGPTATGVTRAVNVAQRLAADSTYKIASESAEIAKGLPEATRIKFQAALTAEPMAATTPTGQLELPGLANQATAGFTPEEMETFSKLKDNQGKLDSIRKAARQGSAATIANSYGKTISELTAQYGSQASALATATGAPLDDVFQMLIRHEGYEEFKPGKIIPGVKSVGDEPIYVPKVVNDTLTRMFNTNIKTGLGMAYDKAMGVFRTAVLPLSLHWHIVHGTGAMALLAADTGPSVLGKLSEAAEMVREGKLPPEISQIGASGQSRLADILSPENPNDVFDLTKGREVANMLDSNKFSKYAETVGKPFGKVIAGSYRVAGMIDQMTGSLAYLYGNDKALTAGMTEEEAHAAGIAQANRVLHDWDGVTPVERQVIRSVFPFYAWMKTISKYLVQYPMNHPWRAAIMSNFANNELQDAKTGIPEEYKNYLTIGKPDSKGNQKAAYISRLNPFSDVTSLFTLGGLLSQTNPFIGAIADSLGINAQTGAGQAFPNVVYNPQTGKQEAAHKNYFSTLAQSFIPQETAIERLLHLESPEEKNLKLTSPESYQNQFWSSLGLPNLRTINQPGIAANAEINRYQALSRTFNTIISSGDFDKLRSFNDPRFDAVADKLDALKASGALAPLMNSKNGVHQLDSQKVLSLLGL